MKECGKKPRARERYWKVERESKKKRQLGTELEEDKISQLPTSEAIYSNI